METWGAKVGVPVVRSDKDGADPASVAFEAAARAKDEHADVLIIDTAGRLQNKANLMDELGKIRRVTEKNLPVDEVLLVLDATTGQNGMAQAKVFAEAIGITGEVLSKLDGSAKGGIVISVQKELGVPVKLVGLGEGPDDLAPFDRRDSWTASWPERRRTPSSPIDGCRTTSVPRPPARWLSPGRAVAGPDGRPRLRRESASRTVLERGSPASSHTRNNRLQTAATGEKLRSAAPFGCRPWSLERNHPETQRNVLNIGRTFDTERRCSDGRPMRSARPSGRRTDMTLQ